jgi:hypothetical protein
MKHRAKSPRSARRTLAHRLTPRTLPYYSKSKRLVLATRISVVTQTAMLLFFLLFLPLALLLPDNQLIYRATTAALVTFVLFGAISMCLLLPLRCDRCRKRMCIAYGDDDYSPGFRVKFWTTPRKEILHSIFAPDELRFRVAQCCKCDATYSLIPMSLNADLCPEPRDGTAQVKLASPSVRASIPTFAVMHRHRWGSLRSPPTYKISPCAPYDPASANIPASRVSSPPAQTR